MKTAGDLTREWFERVWNQQSEAAVHEMLAADCEVAGLNLPQRGPAGFLTFFRAFSSAFEGIRIELMELLEKDEHAFGHAKFRAIHKKSQTPVELEFSVFVRWKDGKIVEAKNVVDFLPMLVQLGQIRPDLVATALS